MIGPRSRAAAVLLFVFAAGALTGIFLERHIWVHAPRPLTAAEEHVAAMKELTELLDLEDEQIEQIHAILADRQRVVQAAWEQLRPELQKELQQVHVEIAQILSPEQRELFHRWLLARRERHDSQGTQGIVLHEEPR